MPTKAVSVLEVFQFVEALTGMRHEDQRILLEAGGDGDCTGTFCATASKDGMQVGAHVEVDLADRQQDAVVAFAVRRAGS